MLQSIHSYEDLQNLSDEERRLLCSEIREFLITNVSQTGGHLASNLGVVELTVAIETVFNTMEDRLVFDVGHQSYVHKLLTGRQADFAHLRQFGGISGFPKPYESHTDAFVAGHASNSVSIALGMARARTLQHEKYNIVTLLGDGAATGGMVYEGLNDAAVSREPMVVILNDNEMSIDRNVGGMAKHLQKLRTQEQYLGAKRRYRHFLSKMPGGKGIYRFTKRIKDWIKRLLLPTTIFENMGMAYLGPVDGHDLPHLIQVLRSARDMRVPVVVHVLTQKGRGYAPAEEDPSRFHGIGKFDPESGKADKVSGISFSDSFGEMMVALGHRNERLCAITAAMPGGTGLLSFQKQFPRKTFDVGIAEEHAVSMAGGLAKQGMVPVVALYSTFLQRGFDQIMEDIALQNLHVVLAVDRAGLVGEDGATHHGVFDVGFLRQIPGMEILCPVSLAEQKDMLRWAVEDCNGPVAIRYPRGGNRGYTESHWQGPNSLLQVHRQGPDVTLLTYGPFLSNVLEAAELLSRRGREASVLRLLQVSQFPVEEILEAMGSSRILIIAEEAMSGSGIRESLAWTLRERCPECQVYGLDLGKQFVPHGSMKELYAHYGLDAEGICKFTLEVLSA